MFISHNMRNKGSSLLETLIYLFIFTLLTLAIVAALTSLARSYRVIQSSIVIESVAHTALEKIVRSARESLSIDFSQSVFGTLSDTLTLNALDQNGNNITLAFFVSDGVMRMEENGLDAGPLSSSNADITRLLFTPITNSQSQAVKIELTAESGQGENLKTRTFYATVVLRGSYVD